MNNLAEMIRSAILELDNDDVTLRESYSGRGMYGRNCPGITGSFNGCMDVIAEVIKAAYGAGDVEGARVVDTLLCFRQDSMGLDVIIYWEDLPEFERDIEQDAKTCPNCGHVHSIKLTEGMVCDQCEEIFEEEAE